MPIQNVFMHKIAVVGGGFSGLLSAYHLLNQKEITLHVYIFEPTNQFPRGVAYSTPYQWHILNVRAMGMSALPDYLGHFVDWLKKQPDYKHLDETEYHLFADHEHLNAARDNQSTHLYPRIYEVELKLQAHAHTR